MLNAVKMLEAIKYYNVYTVCGVVYCVDQSKR